MPVRRVRPARPRTRICRYVDERTGDRCRRVATVSGELCRQCAVALELEIERGSGADRFIGTIDRVIARGYRDPVLSQMGALFGGILGATLVNRAPPSIQEPLRQAGRMAQAAARARAAQAPPPPPRQPPPPPPPDPEADRKRDLARAREILGFEPDDKLTEDAIKTRYRALAKIYHPDVPTGSLKQMQRVNAAAELLTAELAKARRP